MRQSMTGVTGVSQDAGCFGQHALLSSKGGSVTPIVLSAVLITLLRAFMSEVLELSYQREMLLIRTLYGTLVEDGKDGWTEVSPLQPPQEM